jgi:hypothetical protein
VLGQPDMPTGLPVTGRVLRQVDVRGFTSIRWPDVTSSSTDLLENSTISPSNGYSKRAEGFCHWNRPSSRRVAISSSSVNFENDFQPFRVNTSVSLE